MRMNIGVSFSDKKLQQMDEVDLQLVPPLRILAPWAFKAIMSLPESHKGGKLCSYQLICKMTVLRDQELPFEADHLAQFYYVLHEGLYSNDKEVVNEIIGSCSQYFSSDLPSKLLLLLDFIHACHDVAASDNDKAPRLEAQTILGSTLCFPNLYREVQVLTPNELRPQTQPCLNMKDYVVHALIFSARKEPSAPARCVALSSVGIWLFEELSSGEEAKHPRVKEAINVLLVSLKFTSDRRIASSACSQLHLLANSSRILLRLMPDIPLRIIDVMALTASDLLRNNEVKKTQEGQQLVVSLFMCLLKWCMCVPLRALVEEQGEKSGKRIIRTVFKTLQTAAQQEAGNFVPRHRTTHSYTLNDLKTQDFDPELELNQINSSSASTSSSSSTSSNLHKLSFNSSPARGGGADSGEMSKQIRLAAQVVLSHLTNHLGHFPLTTPHNCMLSSSVCEFHDNLMSGSELDDLSPELFSSPNVQFLIFNNSCLMSVIEIPPREEDEKEGEDDVGGDRMVRGGREVRFIVRDCGGKYCWDATLLYGRHNTINHPSPRLKPPPPPPSSVGEVKRDDGEEEGSRDDEMVTPERARLREASIHNITDPDLPGGSDKLDRMLQYVGWTSPECLHRTSQPLNMPQTLPRHMSQDMQDRTIARLIKHDRLLAEKNRQNSKNSCWRAEQHRAPAAIDEHEPFYHARLLLSELGFVSRESRHRIDLLQKNERLLRNLRNIDNAKCRETHKIAVIYIGPGQEDKVSVLSNSVGSENYENFVAGLGWEVNLATHRGFSGKLQKDKLRGETAPYYATSSIEVVFHVATRFSTHDEEGRHRKLKHIGNDEVHIVWSEHHRDYRRDIIPTDFGDVVIVVYPIQHSLYRIDILKKPDVPSFGPLYSGAIVNGRILPVLVRETAVNAGRAKRSHITYYQHFYEERWKYLQNIISEFRDRATFERFTTNLYQPVSSPPPQPATTNNNLHHQQQQHASSLGGALAASSSSQNSNNNNNNNHNHQQQSGPAQQGSRHQHQQHNLVNLNMRKDHHDQQTSSFHHYAPSQQQPVQQPAAAAAAMTTNHHGNHHHHHHPPPPPPVIHVTRHLSPTNHHLPPLPSHPPMMMTTQQRHALMSTQQRARHASLHANHLSAPAAAVPTPSGGQQQQGGGW